MGRALEAAQGRGEPAGSESPAEAVERIATECTILREIVVKGKDSRFKKTERGKFTVAK